MGREGDGDALAYVQDSGGLQKALLLGKTFFRLFCFASFAFICFDVSEPEKWMSDVILNSI